MTQQYATLAAIQKEMASMQIRVNLTTAALWLVSAPFWALGWLVGFLWRCILWAVAACITGYRAGRGQQ